MSGSENVDDSSMDTTCSDEILIDQAENSTGTESENSSSTGDPQHLPFRTMVKPSCELSAHSATPSSPAQKIDQLDVASSSRCVISVEDVRKSLSSFLAPGQIHHEKSDFCTAKFNLSYLSPFAANRVVDLSTPPQCNPVPEIRSFSKNLTETSSPSPDKRIVETDLELAAIKRPRKTPESNSDRPETLTESYGSKKSTSLAEEASRKSPTYLQIQQSVQKNEELKSLNTPSILSKRKRKILDRISGNSSTKNNPCSSESISSFSTVNIHKSSTNLELHESEVDVQDVDESNSGAETASMRGCSAASESVAKPSSPDDLLEIVSSLALPFAASIASVDASSANPNIKAGKQNLGVPTFSSKDAVMHPTTITDTSTRDGESRPLSKEFSVFGSQRIHRRSRSEETRRNRNSPETEPSSTPQRSFPRVNTEESSPPRSLGMDQRFGSNGMFRNLPRDEGLQSFLRFLLDLKYTAINIPDVPIDSSRRADNALRLASRLNSLLSNQPPTARNNPEVQPNLNDSLYYAKLERFHFPTRLHYTRPPAVRSGNNLPYIDGQASTSSYQPRVTEAAVNFQPDFPSNNSTPPDGLQSGENPERTREGSESSTSYSDNHPEYVVNALTLLRSVLKEMMMYNGEEDPWVTCEPLFGNFFESDSKLDRMCLHSALMSYLANRGYGLWTQSLFTTQEVTSEALMLLTHEKFIVIVVTTIGSVLSRNLIEFMKAYTAFKELHSLFTQYWHYYRVEDTLDEISRKHAKYLKEMIQRFILVTRMAMQLMLMSIGENYNEEFLQMLSRQISEEDRMYLRRRV